MPKSFYLMIVLMVIIVTISWLVFKQSDVDVANTSKLKVTVSLPLLRNLVEEIGRDEVAVNSIINGSSCNHEFEPASGDLINVSCSAIFVKTGMGFDLWADKLFENAGEKVLVIDASHGVTAIQDEHNIEHEEDADHEDDSGVKEDHHELGNPHYWGNPENVKIMAGNILKGLIKALPEKEDYFTSNYQAYLLKIDQTVGELKAVIAKGSTKRIVSYSAAFPYFYQYFGLDNLVTVESTCEQEVSPKRLAEVITTIKVNQVNVVVGEAVYPKLPETLAKETEAKLVLLWPATNETGEYLDTLTENVKKLVSALQ